MKKYVIHPESIPSKNDKDVHHIGYIQLIRLYDIDPNLCIDSRRASPEILKSPDYIHLYPDYHGNYDLPRK